MLKLLSRIIKIWLKKRILSGLLNLPTKFHSNLIDKKWRGKRVYLLSACRINGLKLQTSGRNVSPLACLLVSQIRFFFLFFLLNQIRFCYFMACFFLRNLLGLEGNRDFQFHVFIYVHIWYFIGSFGWGKTWKM